MGAVLREQNALPYDTRKLSCLMAKDDVDNVGAGRAAKGAIPGRSPARYSVATILTTTPNKNTTNLDEKSKFVLFFYKRLRRNKSKLFITKAYNSLGVSARK